MKVALIGFDVDGRISYDYYTAKGADVTICDQNETVATPEGATTQLGADYLHDLDRFDVIVRTSGMPASKIVADNPTVEPKVTTQINEFFEASPSKHIIGITGTKGKGTTSTLTAKILEAAGKRVFLGGNIGIPPLSFINEVQPDDWVVLELSSFQLSDIRHSPSIAVCLMVVPEHLNWHTDMADYMQAKSHLFAQQTSSDVAIYFADSPNSKQIAHEGAGRKLSYYRSPGAFVNGNMITIDGTEICTTDELKLLGKHNWQNVCAALTAVWQTGIHDVAAARSVLITFTGLEHRLEFVRELEGVRYYDDSFGTTPETAIVAMEAFTEPKVLILGGSDKGSSYDELTVAVTKNNVRQVLLIGDQAEKLQIALDTVGYTDYRPGGSNMTEIVHNLQASAQSGDIALLSTGCASFGMFKDYKDRGDQFKTAVQTLS